MKNYVINGEILIDHYFSWFENPPKSNKVEAKISLDHAYDWIMCIEQHVCSLENYIYNDDTIKVLKFMMLEEMWFYPYDNITLPALIRISKYLKEKNGYVEIMWGCMPHEKMQGKLQGSYIKENYNPWLMLYLSKLVWRDKLIKSITPTKLFINLNKKPHYHRCCLVDCLAKNKLIDKNIVTWRADFSYLPDAPNYEWKNWNPEKRVIQEITEGWNMPWSMPSDYFSVCIDLVSETTVDIPSVTEKTWRPIILGKAFIAVAFPGYHKWLREKGFLLYDELFDYSFDSLSNVEERVENIANQLRIIQDTYNLNEVRDITAYKVKFNRNHALSLDIDSTLPDFYHKYYEKKLLWWRDIS